MGVLIDSSVLIQAERGRLDLDQRLALLGSEPTAISSITATELLHGVHRAKTAEQRERRERFVEWALQSFSIVPFDLAEARTHARIWSELLAQGTMVGAHDLLIGATALSTGFRVATANSRDFARIPGLKVEVWDA